MNANLRAAEPIAEHLFRQIVSEAGDEDRNDLRVCVFDQFTDARLRAQIRIRIVILVARRDRHFQ